MGEILGPVVALIVVIALIVGGVALVHFNRENEGDSVKEQLAQARVDASLARRAMRMLDRVRTNGVVSEADLEEIDAVLTAYYHH